ncbi:hypothetical protein C7974DRAFT_397250 [Boeremia exigua]|uniref:uncharacterized protein n=1 Tax=Boeremia exigua TaxID=749465 RepID=UPI001E8D7CCA|nr:uncharacterized protein C7974DRAFT_397250 [Boeremia exigua]KAH6621854.1 hypothetical protein C7974DRAFT_397250 [Boeremia exigua]
MALRYALLAFAGVGVWAQTTTDGSNFYSLTDDYYATRRRTSSSVRTSMFWTVTQRYMESVSLEPYTYGTSTTEYSYTYTETIKATVTPTGTATSTYTYTSSYDDVELHQLYYPTGAVAASDLVSRTRYDDSLTATGQSTYTSTEYRMPVTMTAPASCPTPFTVATQAVMSLIPSIVTDQLQPTSTEVSTSSGRSYVAEYSTLYLTAGAAPFSTDSDYNYYYYISSCSPPPAAYTNTRTSGSGGSGSSGSSGSDSWTDYQACYFGGCTSLRTWIIIIATVLPAIFLLGFLESWFWYTRLMRGKSAVRAGTICWVLLSLWVLCFTRMQDARSKEDQVLLTQRWKDMSAGQKFRNWSWGFKRRYPVPLLGQFSKQTVGIVPEGQPLHQPMAQPGGQVFYYGAPPPGWQQGPGGAPQGYPPQGYPQQGAGGYYGPNVPKEGVVVGSSPVQAPQPAYQPAYQPPSSPAPSTQLPPQPQQATPAAPPANVSEVSSEQREVSPVQAPATTQQPTHPVPPKDSTNDDLYR